MRKKSEERRAKKKRPFEECTTLSTLAAEAKLQFAEAYGGEDTDVDPPTRASLDERIVLPDLPPPLGMDCSYHAVDTKEQIARQLVLGDLTDLVL